ncbi:hypothetical protein GDO81_008682 [Engystomops pustulosus]|uniref:Uncharacterized protein n=1 Tax=Engystomops pustulosus TaxID=76066 RepID=A0AAV7CH27_ENGPU|nr:hypothetical protein GDO81_008682 [Engystomops pustulosus]
MYEHNIFKIILIFLTLAVYIVMVAFNAGAGSGLMKDVFLQRVGNLSDKFNTNITPAGWTFMIWNVIFAWQFLWLGYVLAGICRRFLIPALVFLGAIALTNHIVLFISYRALYLHGEWFDKQRRVDLWLIRIFVQNGIAVYATWTTIASLLNFAVALTYNGNIPNGTSTTVCLSLLAFEVLLWFILENFLFDKYVRYTLTVYPVVFVALSGVLDKHFNEAAPDGNNIYIAVLLAVACALFVVRVLLVIWRHFKQPFYSRSTSKTSFPLA